MHPHQYARLCTGDSQRHYQSLTNRKGDPNPAPRAGQPYPTISFDEIAAKLPTPVIAPKGGGPWIMASGYNGPDARTFDVQKERGSFWILAVDIDKGNVPYERLHEVLTGLLPGRRWLIHSTSSAKAEALKWRALMPLAQPIPYEAFECYAKALFAALEHNGIQTDRTLSRSAQLIFLPAIKHPGAFYLWANVPGQPFECGFAAEGCEWLDQHAVALFKQSLEQVQPQAKESGPHSVIGWVNRTFLTESLFEQYGYTFDGKEWSSPHQQGGSGNHSTMVRDDGSWFSLSYSDLAAGVGRPTSHGCNGDAFDLIKFYAFGNDLERALAWAREQRKRAEASTPAMQAAEALVRGMGL